MAELDVWAEIRRLKSQLDRLTSFEWPLYQEGTWTPAFTGTTGAGTFTYTIQLGRYQRIGNHCFFRGNVAISAIPVAPTGNMTITGLPFANVNVANDVGTCWFAYIHNFNYAAAAMDLVATIGVNTAIISLFESFDNVATVAAPAANFTNAACQMVVAGMYQISGS